MTQPLGEAAIFATLDQQYAETRARLASDPGYQRMKADAAAAVPGTQAWFLATNMVTLHEEINMPSITETLERARADRETKRRAHSPLRRLLSHLSPGSQS